MREYGQGIVAALVVCVWLVGVLVALVDGVTLLRLTTPLLTTVLGWLFTAKATGA
jgi:hypothetical protein